MSSGLSAAQKQSLQLELQYYDVSASPYHRVKRILDVVIAGVATLILLIPMAILLLLVYIDDPGKVIFTQNRVGKDGKLFHIYKVRTMVAGTPQNLSAAEFRDAARYVSRMGAFLRKMSLDELCACFGIQRARFDREFERAAADGARIWLLVENATWENAFNGQYRSDLSATSLVGSLISWAARRKMQILFCKSETTPLLIRSILKHEMKLKLEGM